MISSDAVNTHSPSSNFLVYKQKAICVQNLSCFTAIKAILLTDNKWNSNRHTWTHAAKYAALHVIQTEMSNDMKKLVTSGEPFLNFATSTLNEKLTLYGFLCMIH